MRFAHLGLPLLGCLWSACALSQDRTTSAADLLRMRQGGLRDESILSFLQVYEARLTLSVAEIHTLSEAGFKPETLRALQEQRFVPPASPEESGEGPLPRFFVGYPHDPAAFPAWYYGPFKSDSATASQHPGRNAPRAGVHAVDRWRRGCSRF